MIRMSHLPMAEKCGQAHALCSQHGAGRPAVMSQAFHAACADTPAARHLLAALSPQERDEVATWKKPATVVIDGWCSLDYESADKELEVGLDAFGDFTAEEKSAVSWGHLDFAWVRTSSEAKIAFVADIKKSVWTTQDGPESLQLHAYARAYALKHGCQAYVTGIWAAIEGEWLWQKEPVWIESPEGNALLDRIFHAAQNNGDANRGDHCRGCFARLHCPEYTLSAAAAATWLAPFAEGKRELTSEIAAEVKRKLDELKDIHEHVMGDLQEAVRRGVVVVKDESGQKWKPVKMPGRKSADMAKLEAVLGADAQQFIKQGRDYEQFRWVRR
jgi:hypothetical protein